MQSTYLLNDLAEDNDHVLVRAYDERDRGYAVFKVNVYDSKFSKVESAAGDRSGEMAEQGSGDPRLVQHRIFAGFDLQVAEPADRPFSGAAADRASERVVSALRDVFGSLPVRPLAVKMAPTATLTDWVKTQQAAPDFFVLDECELRDTHEDGGIVRCKRQDLTGEEIQLHLTTGKVVTQLSLAWQDKLSFMLDDKMTVKRLKFEDLLQDQAEQDGGDEALGQLDASFTLMMLTFGDFLPALVEALGGEETPQGI